MRSLDQVTMLRSLCLYRFVQFSRLPPFSFIFLLFKLERRVEDCFALAELCALFILF